MPSKPAKEPTQGKHIDRYLPFDVVEAARQRLLKLYLTFDCVVISFSGGKDSLAMTLLAARVGSSLGIKPYVLFMDEEFVPSQTVKFVDWVFRRSPIADAIVPLWCCWQLESSIFFAGKSRTVTQWDCSGQREWVREPPADALMDRENVYDVYSGEVPLSKMFTGRSIAVSIGVRAAESLTRLTTICRGAGNYLPYVHKTKIPGVVHATPLYDWQTNDVFKYLQTWGVVNPIYYEMMCAKRKPKVDTPLWGRHCNLAAYKAVDPVLYDRLVTIFPEVHAAGIYNQSLKPAPQLVDDAVKKYGKTWSGLRRYVEENVDPALLARARAIVRRSCRDHYRQSLRKRYPIATLRYTWMQMVNRNFDHEKLFRADEASAKRDWEWEHGKA